MNLIWSVFCWMAPFGAMLLILKLMDWATRSDTFWWTKKRVWLREADGWRVSRIHIDRNGVQWAPVYPFLVTGHVVLHADGTTSGESSYIKEWTTENPNKNKQSKIEQRNKRYMRK